LVKELAAFARVYGGVIARRALIDCVANLTVFCFQVREGTLAVCCGLSLTSRLASGNKIHFTDLKFCGRSQPVGRCSRRGA